MIVKNESHIICKTFDNILKYVPITYWVISDTGSTDNTIELIKAYWKEKNIDGELVEHAWKDFGYNRTKALESAYNKTDYLLIFDADDSFHGEFKLPSVLNKDSYNLKFGEGFEYVRPLLVNNRRRWKFVGVLHEFLACCEPDAVSSTIDGNYHVESGRTGNRSQDPKKYEKDAKVLETAFHTEKDTSLTDRYAFYCAQSWKDAGEPDNSIMWYKKCLTLNNWYQEKYYSCLMIGNLYKQKGDNMEALKYWLKTTEYDGERMEGIVEAIQFLRESGMNLFVCTLYKKYKGYNKRPNDKLFIDTTKYDSIIEYNASISAYYCGKKEMGMECCRKILMDENASPSSIFSTFGNIQFYEIKPDATLFERVDELICKLSRTGHSIPPSAFEVWNKLINKAQLTKYSPIKNKKPSKSPKIILTMTTCKRFDLFQQTVNSITNTWTDIDVIDYWFCVDDNSSPEDRNQMKKKYNWIDYYMKGPEEKGHRKSMNIIWDKLNELRPTYWIHMEDDFRFHCRMDYIKTGIKYLEGNIKQVLFNRNYGEQIKDYSISGHAPFGATQEIVLHDHKSGSFNYPNCHYWTDYSFRPSIIKVDAILELGNYDSANQFFEKDYADRWYGAGYRSAFFNRITCEHIGKLTSDRTGENAYTMNDESQFVKKNKTETFLTLELNDKVISTEQLKTETFLTLELNDKVISTEQLKTETFLTLELNDKVISTELKIKVINLKRREDRKNSVIENFKNANIENYEFIEAIDGNSLEITNDLIDLFKGNDFGNRKGVIGCALTHYKLWKELIESSDEYYFIMEDDFTLSSDFKSKLESTNYSKYDILFYGYHMFSNVRENMKIVSQFIIERLPMSQYVGGTFSYSINRNGAKKMLDYIEKSGIKHGIDYLFKIIPELECYESKPQLCFSDWNEYGKQIDSDIQNMSISFDFEKFLLEKYDYYPNKDFFGSDIHFQRSGSLIEMLLVAEKRIDCVCFNTFGFYKNECDTNKFIDINCGLYVKKSYSKSYIKRIAFHDNYLSERGTTVALYDYAHYNRKILNNDSIILYNRSSSPEVLDKFKEFRVFQYNNWSEVDDILKNNNVDILYSIKYGTNDNLLSKKCWNVVHSVFDCGEPHGDVYASISPYVKNRDKNNCPVVPHIVSLPDSDKNMRLELGILEDAIVFGRYGGYYQFDIDYVINTVIDVASNNPNIYFIFMNTNKFSDLNNIIYLEKTVDLHRKVEFINTCDAMLWGRSQGETFGLSIAEFSTKNKPVIATLIDGGDNAHHHLLGEHGIWYNKDTLKDILVNFKKYNTRTDWNAYREYNPESVMRIFKNVFIKTRVRIMCDWCSSEQLCQEWSNMCLDGFHWNNIEITWDTKNIDYYVIINRTNETDYDKSRTIVFQMEPWVFDEGKNWGVKTWGDWSVPSGFMKVFSHRNHLNNVQWQIPKIDNGQEKENKIISILSKKNYDEGHIKRIEFIRRLEEYGFDGVDVYGAENYHNYKNYVGKTDNKLEMAKYKYCFFCENNWEKNYATEKIWEPILCECLCFYWGCPNLEEYIDGDAFVRLDLDDFEGAMEIIKNAIEEDWWGARIDIIRREKKKILEELGFFPRLKKELGV
jgi:GR25 family glycosyltransferase involved in LPS biosynthesis